jgi:hypothetical protein
MKASSWGFAVIAKVEFFYRKGSEGKRRKKSRGSRTSRGWPPRVGESVHPGRN